MTPGLQSLKLIWIAFLVTVPIYTVLPFVIGGGTADDPTVPLVLLAVGVVNMALGLFAVPVVLKAMPAQTAFLIRWCFFESGALMGFVAMYLGAPWFSGPLISGLAMIALVVTGPTDDAYTEWEVKRLGGE